jgi:hypothetical protein
MPECTLEYVVQGPHPIPLARETLSLRCYHRRVWHGQFWQKVAFLLAMLYLPLRFTRTINEPISSSRVSHDRSSSISSRNESPSRFPWSLKVNAPQVGSFLPHSHDGHQDRQSTAQHAPVHAVSWCETSESSSHRGSTGDRPEDGRRSGCWRRCRGCFRGALVGIRDMLQAGRTWWQCHGRLWYHWRLEPGQAGVELAYSSCASVLGSWWRDSWCCLCIRWRDRV